MEISKGVTFEFKEGKAVLAADVAALIVPKLDEIKAKVESGEIDPIPNFSGDNVAIIAVIEMVKAEIMK